MSIRGDVPIPCFNGGFCERAGDGENYCNPVTKHCENPVDPYSINFDPLGECARKFRYPAQGTFGSRADLSGPTQREDPITIDPLTWRQTVHLMWIQTTSWESVKVPGIENPTFWEKFSFIYLSTQKRAIITAAIIVLITIIILLL